MITRNIIFRIDSRKKRTKEGEDEEKKFTYDFQVDTWVIQEKMDFSVYDARPTYRIMENKSRVLLNAGLIVNQNCYLERNTITLYDHLINVDSPTHEPSFF